MVVGAALMMVSYQDQLRENIEIYTIDHSGST